MPAGPLELVAATFVFALLGGIVPVFNVEAYLLSVSTLAPQSTLAPVVLAAAAGQMAAKSLLYLGGRGLLRLPLRATRARVEGWSERLGRARGGAAPVVLLSAVTGVPPFYGVSVAAGALHLRFATFLAIGIGGRVLRFAVVFLLPRLV